MNVELVQELVNQLGSSLEHLETQHAALFQFLKDQDVVTDEQLAPYLAQAGRSSGVRWRATRVRLDSLINAEKTREEEAAGKEKQRQGEERAPGQSQVKEGQGKDGQSAESQDKAGQSIGGPEKEGDRRKDQEKGGDRRREQEKEGSDKSDHDKSDQDRAGQEKNTQPKTEEASGKPTPQEQKEDAKIAEQAYSSIPTSKPASETDKKQKQR